MIVFLIYWLQFLSSGNRTLTAFAVLRIKLYQNTTREKTRSDIFGA